MVPTAPQRLKVGPCHSEVTLNLSHKYKIRIQIIECLPDGESEQVGAVGPPVKVFLHSSVPGRSGRHAIWSAKLSRLGLKITQGPDPDPGTRLAVVGGEERLEPFSAEAELLLRRRNAAAAQQRQQQQQRQPTASTAPAPARNTATTATTATITTTTTTTTTATPSAAVRAPDWLDPPSCPVMLVADSWLVDCSSAQRLLDPAAYDVRQRARDLLAAPLLAQWRREQQQRPPGERPAKRRRRQSQEDDSGEEYGSDGGGGSGGGGSRRSGLASAGAGGVESGGAAAAAAAAPPSSTFSANRSTVEAAAAKQLRPWVPPRVVAGSPQLVAESPQPPQLLRSAEASTRVTQAVRQARAELQPVPPRPWVPPRVVSGSPVVVGEAPQPLGWWDPTRGSFVLVPDHHGRPRPPEAPPPPAPAELLPKPSGAGTQPHAAAVRVCVVQHPGKHGLPDDLFRSGPEAAPGAPGDGLQGSPAAAGAAELRRGHHLPADAPAQATQPLRPMDPAPPLRFNPFTPGVVAAASRRQRNRRSGPLPRAPGYTGAGGGGGGGVPRETDGVALLIRRRRLELVALRCEQLSHRIPPPTSSGSGGQPFWGSLRNRGVVGLLALVRLRGCEEGGGRAGSDSELQGGRAAARNGCGSGSGSGRGLFVVGTTHIWWDPRLPDVKLGQAHLLCRAAADFARSQGWQRPQDLPLVLCGDWNTRWLQFDRDRYDKVAPGGCLVGGVYELLTRGSLGAEHPHHPSARHRAAEAIKLDTAGLLLSSAHLTANGREPAATVSSSSSSSSRNFRACLDYVWLSRGHWAVSATLDMPYRYGRDPRRDSGDDAPTPLVVPPASDEEEAEDAPTGAGTDGPGGGGGDGGPGAGRGGLALGMVGRRAVWQVPMLPDGEWPSDHWAIGVELLLLQPAQPRQ